jgi:hypothetical protein
MPTISGHLSKMATQLNPENGSKIQYQLCLNDERIDLNPLLGQTITINYVGEIHCCHCGRKTNKSFSQGYCYPCFKKLPQCDLCIMSPEKCHYHLGTCRDSSWGDDFCMQDHYVYLANSSALKVGITRGTQLPTRWCDQGATQGLPIFRVRDRLLSGLVETLFKQTLADKTNWRTMLKGNADVIGLEAIRDELYQEYAEGLNAIELEYGPGAITYLPELKTVELEFPVDEFPTKISSLNFDKTPEIQGKLMGIKGQYLLLDCGVINLRKFTSYNIEFTY